MNYQIGKLPRAIREDLFNMHACFTNPEANERLFYLKRVPVKIIDLKSIDSRQLYKNMSDDECDEYMNAVTEEPELAFGVVSEDKLMDGMHRITSRLRKGLDTMYAVDLTGLIDPGEYAAGHICTVEFTDRPVLIEPSKNPSTEFSL